MTATDSTNCFNGNMRSLNSLFFRFYKISITIDYFYKIYSTWHHTCLYFKYYKTIIALECCTKWCSIKQFTAPIINIAIYIVFAVNFGTLNITIFFQFRSSLKLCYCNYCNMFTCDLYPAFHWTLSVVCHTHVHSLVTDCYGGNVDGGWPSLCNRELATRSLRFLKKKKNQITAKIHKYG